MIDYKLMIAKKKAHRPVAIYIDFRLLIIPILITVLFIVLTGTLVNSREEYITREVVVRDGDTLWSIIKSNYSIKKDIREYIYLIREFNNLASAQIYPGQVLLLPEIE